MTKLKKAALFTDIHWGKRNNSEEHNQDCARYIEWFIEQVQADPDIDHIYFLGDWHEHRAAINGLTLKYSYEGAKRLDSLGLPIYFVVGNHDLYFRNNRKVFTTGIFDAFKNFVLIDSITKLDEVHGGAIVVPFLNEDEYPELIEYKDVPVALGHFELKGFVITGDTKVMEHGPDYNTFFKKQKRVFSGHFHKRQNQGNVYYIGNTFPMDFSDTNDIKRGMATYDFVNDKLLFTDWADGPRFIKATLSEVLENPKKILLKNARVKIDVDSEITFEESNQIRSSLQAKYGLREITLDEKMTIDVNMTDDETAIEELHLETTNEVIQELLKRIKDDSVDTKLLLKIYNSLSAAIKDSLSKATKVEFMELTMQNYLSYGNNLTMVNLNFDNPTLIIGRNYDSVVEGQVDSNGAGKSTILNALLMCAFDKNLMNIDKNGQINKSNGKNMMLTLTFKVNDVFYKIERYRKNKVAGGDGVRLYVNDKEPVFTEAHDKTPDSVANCNAEIERILGIPYEMFIRIVVFSATHEPFLSLPSSHASKANQRDIVEELFGLTELTIKAEKLKELLSASKAEFKNLIEVNGRLEAERERHNTQVETNIVRLNEWDTNRVNRLNEIETQIALLEAIDLAISIEGFEEAEKQEKELVKVEKNIPALEAELRNIKSLAGKFNDWNMVNQISKRDLAEKISKLEATDFNFLRSIRDELAELKPKYDLKKSAHDGLTAEFSNLHSKITSKTLERVKKSEEIDHLSDNTCPYCQQQFADAKVKVGECEHTVKVLDIEIQNLEAEKDIIASKIHTSAELIEVMKERLNYLRDYTIPANLDQMEASLGTLRQQLIDLESAQNPHVASEDDLTEEDINTSLDGLKAKAAKIRSKIQMAKEFIHPSFKSMGDVQGHMIRIENLKSRVDEIDAEVNPFISVVDSLQSVKHEPLKTERINVLDKEIKHQDFLLKLLTKKDSFIRKALLNKSIPLLNARLRYNLDKVGLSHKVQFTEEMEVKISQFGSEYEYGNFSAGQKARVNLCLAFAFRDVLQSRFGRINLCILDECLDTGLGNVGVTQATKMIKAIAAENKLSMFVISHRDEVSNMFDKRLEIELRNGFSTILGNDDENSIS